MKQGPEMRGVRRVYAAEEIYHLVEMTTDFVRQKAKADGVELPPFVMFVCGGNGAELATNSDYESLPQLLRTLADHVERNYHVTIHESK